MRSPSEEQWKQMLFDQEQLNKQLTEQSKQFEKAKKDMMNQEYLAYINEKQKKNQEQIQRRQHEQQEMESKLNLLKDERQSQVQAHRVSQSALSLNYQDQMNLQKQQQQDKKKQQLQEAEENAERLKMIASQEQEKKLKQRQDAHEEMTRFYNLKKQQEEEKHAANKASRGGVLNDSNSEPSFFQSGDKEQASKKNYYQRFSDRQSIAAKGYLSIENNKDKRIQDFIEKGAEKEKLRLEQEEEQRRQILNNRRLDLKNGLQMQLALKEQSQKEQRQSIMDSQNDILQKSIDQQTFQNQQRQKRLDVQSQYRDQLNFQVAEKGVNKEVNKNNRSTTAEPSLLDSPQTSNDHKQNLNNSSVGNIAKLSTPLAKITNSIWNSSSLPHNPLLNPVPSNMQNPYLIKQLMHAQTPSGLANANRLSYANLAQANIMASSKNLIY